MRKASLFGLGLGLLVFTTGCGDSPEKVTKDSISLGNEIASILEDVKDEDSAKKAVAKLEKLESKAKDIGERAKKLKMKDMSEDKQEALKKKFQDDSDKLKARFKKIGSKADNPELLGALMKVMQPLAEAMPSENDTDASPRSKKGPK